jgi:hypothetical protein
MDDLAISRPPGPFKWRCVSGVVVSFLCAVRWLGVGFVLAGGALSTLPWLWARFGRASVRLCCSRSCPRVLHRQGTCFGSLVVAHVVALVVALVVVLVVAPIVYRYPVSRFSHALVLSMQSLILT